MSDHNKTKKQLIEELALARGEVARLKAAEAASKHLVAKLQESEERFLRLFEDGPLGIVIGDENYRVLKSNRAFCSMLGYSEAELRGRSIAHITRGEAGEEPEQSDLLLQLLLTGKIPLFHVEKRCTRRTGEPFWVNLTVAAIRGGTSRKIHTVLGMLEDIHQRKIIEQEKERLAAEMQQALGSIKTLRGLLPMCAWCKKIRNDMGYWQKVETYIQEHSDVSFTHGICPDCLDKFESRAAVDAFTYDKDGKKLRKERRRFERGPYRETSTYRLRCKGAPDTAALDAQIHDISSAGMCVRTTHPLERYSVILFNDNGSEKTGIVKWKKRVGADDGSCLVGIEFLR